MIMLKLGLDPRWVHMAMVTITTALYLVYIDQQGAKRFYQAITRNKTRGPTISILICTLWGGVVCPIKESCGKPQYQRHYDQPTRGVHLPPFVRK